MKRSGGIRDISREFNSGGLLKNNPVNSKMALVLGAAKGIGGFQ